MKWLGKWLILFILFQYDGQCYNDVVIFRKINDVEFIFNSVFYSCYETNGAYSFKILETLIIYYESVNNNKYNCII